jgi:SRSO17 transposase
VIALALSFRSTLPADTAVKELEQELGPGHFEVRSWRGFRHHVTLCIAAYGFSLLSA